MVSKLIKTCEIEHFLKENNQSKKRYVTIYKKLQIVCRINLNLSRLKCKYNI